jgi:hypothetical protein
MMKGNKRVFVFQRKQCQPRTNEQKNKRRKKLYLQENACKMLQWIEGEENPQGTNITEYQWKLRWDNLYRSQNRTERDQRRRGNRPPDPSFPQIETGAGAEQGNQEIMDDIERLRRQANATKQEVEQGVTEIRVRRWEYLRNNLKQANEIEKLIQRLDKQTERALELMEQVVKMTIWGYVRRDHIANPSQGDRGHNPWSAPGAAYDD